VAEPPLILCAFELTVDLPVLPVEATGLEVLLPLVMELSLLEAGVELVFKEGFWGGGNRFRSGGSRGF
jgi:hypothetical protein